MKERIQITNEIEKKFREKFLRYFNAKIVNSKSILHRWKVKKYLKKMGVKHVDSFIDNHPLVIGQKIYCGNYNELSPVSRVILLVHAGQVIAENAYRKGYFDNGQERAKMETMALLAETEFLFWLLGQRMSPGKMSSRIIVYRTSYSDEKVFDNEIYYCYRFLSSQKDSITNGYRCTVSADIAVEILGGI